MTKQTLPEPPYYAVIFSSQLSDDTEGYARMAERMLELAGQQSGFLGTESAREEAGFGITVSYWQDEAAILAWKSQIEHQAAQKAGKEKWYAHYSLRISRVERSYTFPD